jgi:heme-degrading monooxygenase HmoA
MDSSGAPNSASARPVADAGYLVIWEFLVKPEAQAAFEKAYGPEGDWARLFRQSREHFGTQLLRDLIRPGRYLTFDRWTSRDAFLQFKKFQHNAYAALDARCEALTHRETLIGEFEFCTGSGVSREL